MVSGADETRQAIEKLAGAGLITADEGDTLMHTDEGAVLFKELSGKIKDMTQALYGDLPGTDLEATHRTLQEIAKRANSLLSASKL